MALVLTWLAFAMLAGVIASNKGRSGFGFFMLAFLLSPLIGIIAALAAQPSHQGRVEEAVKVAKAVEEARALTGPEAQDRRKCPVYAELILTEAVKCRYCGELVTPVKPVVRSSESWKKQLGQTRHLPPLKAIRECSKCKAPQADNWSECPHCGTPAA